MAKGKKTIEVKAMLDYANIQLARNDDYSTKEFKTGIVVMIERILMDTNNYKGFSFVDITDCEIDTDGYYNRVYS